MMSSSPNDCETSDEVTRQVYVALAIGISGVLCLALSIVGLAAELEFVCKKKNNFLLRLYIYLSVAVLLVHVTDRYTVFVPLYLPTKWAVWNYRGFGILPSIG